MMEKEFDKSDNPKDLEDWKYHQNMILSELFPSIRNREEALKSREAAAFKKKRHPIPFNSIPIGTPVMIWDQHRQDKNESPYVGPYVIADGSADGRYQVVDPSTGAKYHRDITLDQMKVCRLAVLPTNVEDLESYYLDFILDHRRNPKTQSHEYLVRFAGFNEADDMWLPAEGIEPHAIKAYNQTLTRLSRTNQEVKDRLIQEYIAAGNPQDHFEDEDSDSEIPKVPKLKGNSKVSVIGASRGDAAVVLNPHGSKKSKPNNPAVVVPVEVPKAVVIDDSRGESKRKRTLTASGAVLLQKRKL